MNWKLSSALVCLPVLLCAAAPIANKAGPIQAAALEEYRRAAQIPFPEDNPYSEAKAELGRMLFFDPILSGSRSRSCATCHNPSLSWGDGLPRAIGEAQTALRLRSPTLIDIAWIPRLGWDGGFRNIEDVTF